MLVELTMHHDQSWENWLNPHIWAKNDECNEVSSYQFVIGQSYELYANVKNNGPMGATGVKVHFYIRRPSTTVENFNSLFYIGESSLEAVLKVNDQTDVGGCPWTVQNGYQGHNCLYAICGCDDDPLPDQNPDNDVDAGSEQVAQHNVSIIPVSVSAGTRLAMPRKLERVPTEPTVPVSPLEPITYGFSAVASEIGGQITVSREKLADNRALLEAKGFTDLSEAPPDEFFLSHNGKPVGRELSLEANEEYNLSKVVKADLSKIEPDSAALYVIEHFEGGEKSVGGIHVLIAYED